MMMSRRGRPRKGIKTELKMKQYLSDYELDDLNLSNDMASLRQLCDIELKLEALNKALDQIDPTDHRGIRDLTTSIKDLINAHTNIQDSLGIARKKRKSETEDKPLTFIERLKQDATKFLDKRLVKIECEDCKVTLAKYYIYVKHKAEGETGVPSHINSLNAKKNPPVPIHYLVEVECPQCGKVYKHEAQT